VSVGEAEKRRTYPHMPDPLGDLPRDYWDTGDLRKFMERASPWILDFCYHRLNSDPDVVGDFYVYFYERATICLDKYKSRQHLPFTGYLATYLRHEYYNFIRPRSHCAVEATTIANIHGLEGRSRMQNPFSESEKECAMNRIAEMMAALPLRLRLPLKLHYGFDLNCEELRDLVSRAPSPGRAAEFLLEFNNRRDSLRKKIGRLRNRAAHLNHLIHASPTRGDLDTDARTWRRWKNRILGVLSRNRSVYTQGEIAGLLGVSRSTVSRRVARALEIIRGGELWNTEVN